MKSRRQKNRLATSGYQMKPGENIFLLLGFPPDEAQRYKADSDRRIAAKMNSRQDENAAGIPPSEKRAFKCVDLTPLGHLSGDDLTIGHIYAGELQGAGWVRIFDASGEDYLYPLTCFNEVQD